jgi:hypothetical protein
MGAVSKGKRINYVEAALLYVVFKQSIPQVANHLNTTGTTVIRALKTLGVKTRSISDGKSLRCLGNKSKASKGYVYISIGKYNRKLEHVYVAEQMIGRTLEKNEVVHHKNGDRKDNRRENLEVMTRSAHSILHGAERRQKK